MYPHSIQKLISLFSRFPTIGPRTAARFVFYLLKLQKEEVEELVNSISDLREKVKLCFFCFKPFEPASAEALADREELCDICSNPKRDKTLLCVVEKETDLETIEKTKKYQGRYFILGGVLPKLKQEETQNLRVQELTERIEDAKIKEVILALNPIPEDEATLLYLERLLKPLNVKTTRLGRGLPLGGELEYADEETLSSALEGRK